MLPDSLFNSEKTNPDQDLLAQQVRFLLERLLPESARHHLIEDTGQILQALQGELNLVRLERGEILFREGEEGDALYLVVSGRIRPAVQTEQGGERYLADKGRGEIVGEMAVLTGDKRSATLYALRDTILLRLSKAGFEHLMERNSQIAMRIIQVVIERLRLETSSKNIPAPPNTIAIVPLGREVPLEDFVNRLSRTLAGAGDILHLNSARLPAHFEADSPPDFESNSERLTSWLNDQDTRYRFVLYEADPTLTPWTRCCLRQADRVLLVGTTHSATGPGEVEMELNRLEISRFNMVQELVILHPITRYVSRPSMPWLAGRKISRHYHVCLSSADDLARLARGLIGQSCGLVLGGGGARGFAHIGIIRALEEAGVKIDLVGGTSAGSIAGALYALGESYQEMTAKARMLFSTFSDYTLPLVSVISGSNFHKALRALFDNRQIEDLWLDFFCISSDLTSAEMMLHRRGPLLQAVRASCSIPGVFPPVTHHGHLLVDGGILNNVPVDVMRELCGPGPVIVADLGAELDNSPEYEFEDSLSGWQLIRRRLFDRSRSARTTPGILSILSRSTGLSSTRITALNRDKASLYLTPPLAKFGTLDVKACNQLIEVGYRYTAEKLEQWQKEAGFPALKL